MLAYIRCRMRVRLLGYLSYVAGRETLELEVRSLGEAVERLSRMEGIGEVLFRDGRLWEGVLLILNGRVVHGDVEVSGSEDELVITLPTAGG